LVLDQPLVALRIEEVRVVHALDRLVELLDRMALADMTEVGRERPDDRREAEQDRDHELEAEAGDVLLAASVPADVHMAVPAHGADPPEPPGRRSSRADGRNG